MVAAPMRASVRSARSPTSASLNHLVRLKVATLLGTDRPHVLRQAIHSSRNFGAVSVIGVYGGFVDKVPMGGDQSWADVPHGADAGAALPAEADGASRKGRDRPIFCHHHPPLEDGPAMYKKFRDKQDGCIRW